VTVHIDDRTVPIGELTLEEWRQFMAEFMSKNQNSSSAWDIMGCVRGPDSPSETLEMDNKSHQKAYRGRRERKYNTVEVIREAMFFGRVGGAARFHKGSSVKVNSSYKQDHFDKHVVRAATALGLKVEYLS